MPSAAADPPEVAGPEPAHETLLNHEPPLLPPGNNSSSATRLPSVLLHDIVQRARGATSPFGAQEPLRACQLVCGDWRDGLRREWRSVRCGPGGPALAAPRFRQLGALRRVEVHGEADAADDDDTALTLEYMRSGDSTWRQIVELEMRRAPARLLRLLGAAPFLPALRELTATRLGAAQLADLSRCLTRDRLPSLHKLALTLSDGCASPPLDWPHAAGGATLPPALLELSVLGPPLPLGPYVPPTIDNPPDPAGVDLTACATVTPRLLRALAPTLRALALSVSPSRDATVLVEEPPAPFVAPARPPVRRQLVPLEALAPFFVLKGEQGTPVAAAPLLPHLSRLTLCGDLDLNPLGPRGPAPAPPAPGGGAAAIGRLAAAIDHGDLDNGWLDDTLPPVHVFCPRFERRERRAHAAGLYRRARRARGRADFKAVVGALSELESLAFLPSLHADALLEDDDDDAPMLPPPRLLLGPEVGLEPLYRAWLPPCLAKLTRLSELVFADGPVDALRSRKPLARYTYAEVGVHDSGWPMPPALRRLVLGGAGGGGRGRPCIAHLPLLQIDGGDDTLESLPPLLEHLAIVPASGLNLSKLPRGLLAGRGPPGLRTLDVSPAVARRDAAFLDDADKRGELCLTVEGEPWAAWRAREVVLTLPSPSAAAAAGGEYQGAGGISEEGDRDDEFTSDGGDGDYADAPRWEGWSSDGENWPRDYAMSSGEEDDDDSEAEGPTVHAVFWDE